MRRDGTVGDVRVLQGLGFGLDERAISAVRRWRFTARHAPRRAGGRARRSGDGVQAPVRNPTMTALLVAVTFGALGLAGALLFYVLRLTRAERSESDARVAALGEMIDEGSAQVCQVGRVRQVRQVL